MKNLYPVRLIALLLATSNLLPTVHGQITGGRQVFQFMTLSPSSRVTALGGAQIAVRDDDVAFAALNPAALNPTMSGRLTFQHNFFLTDIQHGYAAYAHDLPKWGFTVHGGLQYVNYGDIQQADEFGNLTGGKINASETALTLGGARPLTDRISLGLNVRMGFRHWMSTALQRWSLTLGCSTPIPPAGSPWGWCCGMQALNSLPTMVSGRTCLSIFNWDSASGSGICRSA